MRRNAKNFKLKDKLVQYEKTYADIANEMNISRQSFLEKINLYRYHSFTFCEKFYLAHRFGMRVEEIE